MSLGQVAFEAQRDALGGNRPWSEVRTPERAVWEDTALATIAAWVRGTIAAEREATRNWSGTALAAREDILNDLAARAGLV